MIENRSAQRIKESDPLILISAVSAGAASAGGMGAWESFFFSGTLGGVSSMMSGGKFGHGFISAGLGAAAGSHFDYGVTGMSVAMVIGGTMSEVTGGKFANGAASAAFSYAMSWAVQKYGVGGDAANFGEGGTPKDIDEDYFKKIQI